MWNTIKIILKIILEIILSCFIAFIICAVCMALWALVVIWPIFIPIITFLCIFGLLLYYMFN